MRRPAAAAVLLLQLRLPRRLLGAGGTRSRPPQSADATAGPTRGYTRRFGGTSGASAIIAGAAAALLGAAQVAGVQLGSGEVRALLSDPALNTPSAVPGRDRIGVMPDLEAILSSKGL